MRSLVLSLLSQRCRVKDSLKVSSSFTKSLLKYTHRECWLGLPTSLVSLLLLWVGHPIQVTIPRLLSILSLSVGIDVSVTISALLESACTLAVLFPLPGMRLLLHGVSSRCYLCCSPRWLSHFPSSDCRFSSL